MFSRQFLRFTLSSARPSARINSLRSLHTHPTFSAHPPPHPRPRWRRNLLWAVPVGAGLTLVFLPQPQSLFPTLLSSPNIIPCSSRPRPLHINSPHEPPISIPRRILRLLRDWIWEPLLTGRRFIHLFILFTPVLLTSPMLLLGVPDPAYDGDRWGAVWWYGFLVSQMNRAGPTFIKLAQWAGSRTDLFPPILCERLGALHSRGKPHSLRHTKRVIEHVFHQRFEDVFEEFNETPIGVGAIAQVYRATLKPDLLPPSYIAPKRPRKSGPAALSPSALQHPPPVVPTAAVAIKILHPKVTQLISRDLSIMRFFARALTLLPGVQWLSLPEEVEAFGMMMAEQIDLRHEADNLVRFEENFSARRNPVTFPRPMRDWSTKDMLVEEYQNAISLETFLKNGGGPFDDQLAELGLDAFLNMLLLDNFVHSDLHPGNIMVKFSRTSTTLLLKNVWAKIMAKFSSSHPGPFLEHDASQHASDTDAIVGRLRELKNRPKEWHAELDRLHEEGYLPEVVFIDAGLTTTLNTTNRANFLDLFRAIAEFDGYRAGQLMVERCRTPELALDPEIFALKIQHLVLDVRRKTFALGQIRIADVLTEVLRAVRVHHVKMEADFVNTVLGILLLEGIGRQLDPTLDLFKSALPILRQLGKQMAKEGEIQRTQTRDLGAMLKIYFYLEARGLANAALVDIDDLVKYDLLVPSI